jgi:hypothetical protein
MDTHDIGEVGYFAHCPVAVMVGLLPAGCGAVLVVESIIGSFSLA